MVASGVVQLWRCRCRSADRQFRAYDRRGCGSWTGVPLLLRSPLLSYGTQGDCAGRSLIGLPFTHSGTLPTWRVARSILSQNAA